MQLRVVTIKMIIGVHQMLKMLDELKVVNVQKMTRITKFWDLEEKDITKMDNQEAIMPILKK